MKEKFNFALIAIDNLESKNVLHICMYEEEPEDTDMESLREELSTDEELGLVGTKFTIVKCPPVILSLLLNDIQKD